MNNNYTTADNATTDLSGGATLQVDGTFTQSNNAVLQVDLAGRTNTEAAISTGTAVIGGALVIDNFAPLGRSASDLLATNYVIIDSTNLIQGNFTSVDFGGVASSVDYITLAGTNNGNTYTVGFGLTWNAALDKSSGTFTLANPDDVFVVDVALDNKTTGPGNPWDGRTLTKEGAGTLVLASATGNSYTGDTIINGGTLQMGVANAIENSGAVKVNANGTLDLNGFNQTVKNISGDGKIMLTNNAVLTVNNDADATLGGAISGTGSLVKTDGSTLTLSGDNSYSGGTTVNNGKLVATNGHAAGSGAITVAASGALELNFAWDDTLANTINNSGALTKTGGGNATLTGTNSVSGSVNVSGGGLTLAQGDTFNVANDYTTGSGASTGLDNNTTLAVSGTFTQAAGSTLNVAMGGTEPMITANQVNLDGVLNITGFTLGTRSASSATQNRHVIIRSDTDINGDFDRVDFGGAAVDVDYLRLSGQVEGNEYVVGLGLTWFAGTQYGNGVFTLTSATDSFDVDLPLTNQNASNTGWDGTTLTKNGAGTLILSAVNTYTGATLVNGGTLQMGVTDAIKTSSAVTLASGTTLDLNNFNQTMNNLSGAGNIMLGSGTLTMINNNDATLSGVISGTGGLVKQGTGNLTLSNASGTSAVDSVDVSGGGLTFTANTGFATTGNYTTAADASTTLGLGATLNVGGSFTQDNDATLNITLGAPGTTPVITADNATLGGALKITYATLARKASELPQVSNVLIQSNAPIINDFSSVYLGGVQSSVDYLTISGQIVNDTQYVIGLGLSWLAGPTLGHGTFTLADAADVFEVDIDLTNENASVTGWDGQTLTKRGDGTLIMSGVNSYSGKTLVESGTLLVGITDGTDAVIAGTVTEVSAGATLAGKGTVSAPVNNSGFISAFNAVAGYESEAASSFTVGHLTNSGTILLAGGNVGNTLTIQGGLASQNGSLIINTVLGGDNSLTDKLVIDGGNVSGTTAVVVRNAGGGGGLTDIGILVIDAQNGATTSNTAFELSAASPGARAIGGTQTTITAGAYDYALVRGGVGGNEQSWYLVSAYGGNGGSARPEAGAYLANREAAESMFRLTMHDRMMSYNRLEQVVSGQKVSGVVWTRFNTGWRTTYADGRNLKTKIDTMVFQAGMDVWRYTDDNFGSLQTGVMLGIGHADGKTNARGGILNARSKTEGWSAGIYGTWFQNPYRRDGLYADAWLQHSWFDNTTNGRGLPKEDYKSRMWSASLETGYAMTLYKTPDLAISIDPFVQVIYSHYSADKIREAGGTIVKQKNSDLFTTRLGGRLHGDFRINEDLSLQPYLEISWWHNSQTGRISMDFDTVRSGMPKDFGELKLGLNSKIGQSTTLSLGLFTQFGGNKYKEFGGQVGLRFDW